jgi:hypothetical protein
MKESVGVGETVDIAILLYRHDQVPGFHTGRAMNAANDLTHGGVGS